MRGFIELLLVSKSYRRQGGATLLLQALEAEALQKGKTVLVS